MQATQINPYNLRLQSIRLSVCKKRTRITQMQAMQINPCNLRLQSIRFICMQKKERG